MAMVPHDDFTPYGYLDNPYHSWKINPSGVLRSLQPLGMGWHVPNLGSYVHNQFQYTAHLTIGLKIRELVLVTPDDFLRNKCTINSQLHTKNRFEYTCFVPKYDLTLTARYFLVHEHALGCLLSLSTTSDTPLPVTCFLIHCHIHNPNTSRLWEHGLYALQSREHGIGMLGLASEGDVFIHGASAVEETPVSWGEMGFGISLEDIAAWARGRAIAAPDITQREQETGWQVRALALPCSLTLEGSTLSNARLNVVLARGVSQDQTYKHWKESIKGFASVENERLIDDETFWERAPQLSGDWPASWRRGMVYDLETLRMTIRPPAGIIPTYWDGMQTQAPRTVLAEAAMDVLFLSYADHDLAAEVILGHFESSPHPNLPCMREDGSYNMVADDGQICGTAPEWGYPLWCCDLLFRRTGDLHWLGRLYPKAAAYLRWWLENRRDAEGWMVYACSWESGQDVSSRFGPQQTGGTIIQHVRPVDLQASIALSAEILARWATLLAGNTQAEADQASSQQASDLAQEAAWWQKIAFEYAEKTRTMWRNGWFRDYDSMAREWSTQQDAMHLAPVFCGVVSREQVEQLRQFLAQPPMHSSGWAPLSWPPVVMTLVGAAAAANMPVDAAELAFRFIDGSYRSTDGRELDEYGGLPGVTREYRRSLTVGKWGAIDYVNAGIEGYGWGALSVFLLIRYVMGLREEEQGVLTVAPVVPQALRRKGASYKIAPVQWGTQTLSVECVVRDADSFVLRLGCLTGESQPMHQWEWEGKWGEERKIMLSSKEITPEHKMD
jgi:Mannosylglycerate hydrolase MGH1-like glycoside hydrolase domain